MKVSRDVYEPDVSVSCNSTQRSRVNSNRPVSSISSISSNLTLTYLTVHCAAGIEFPEKRKLRIMEKAPQPLYAGQKMPKMPKQLIDMRGPEPIHTFLVHKQYGI